MIQKDMKVFNNEAHLILIKEHMQLSDRYAQVGFVEFVEIIPAKRSELSPLLHNGMEEYQTKKHSLPSDLFKTSGEKFRISNGVT